MISRRSILFAALTLPCVLAAQSVRGDEPNTPKTIRLTIDYGDGSQKVFTEVAWNEKATVLGALEAAAKHPRGIKFEHRGSGRATLITAIDGLKNEGRGRNWLYEVNGKLGETSCAIAELQPGDAVLWRFAEYK